VIHSDDAFAQVAYLKFKKCSVVEKTEDEMDMSNVIIQDWKNWDQYEDIVSAVNNVKETKMMTPKLLSCCQSSTITEMNQSASMEHSPFFAISGTTAFDKDPAASYESIEDETLACMEAVQEKLYKRSLNWKDVVTVNVFVSNMDDFGRINTIYKQFFDINPSPR
jgi:diphthine-ammonia ligase